MTTHHLYQDTLEDRRTLRRLGLVIGCFMLATAALAITLAIVAG
jgi:hypothetical protein